MIEGWGLAAVAVGVGGAIAGATISGNAAQSAAQTSANAAQAGTNAQLSMFNTTQQDYAPQIALGQGAANMLSGIYGTGSGTSGGTTTPGGSMTGNASGPGNVLSTGTPSSGSQPNPNYAAFYNTPGYQFSLNQGEQAINKQAAATGGLYSSNTLAAQGSFAQGQASTQYNSYINQLLSMAGLGNAAASGVGTAATATGQGVAGSLLNAGNAQASGILGQSNAFTNALGSVGNSNLLGSLTGSNNSGAAGQYSGEYAPGVSTGVTFQDPYTSGTTGAYGG